MPPACRHSGCKWAASSAAWGAGGKGSALWPGLCASAEVVGGSRELVMRWGWLRLRAPQEGPSQHQAPPRKRITQLHSSLSVSPALDALLLNTQLCDTGWCRRRMRGIWPAQASSSTPAML